MALYSKVEYWNERYKQSRNLPPYDWYQNYDTLAHLLNPETLSGCSASSAHTLGNSNNNNVNNNSNNLTLDDDASASTTAMTNATAAKAYHCLHPSNCRVLILGCGNSTLGAHMYEAGWRGGGGGGTSNYEQEEAGTAGSGGGRFVQVDFSPVVIDQMKERYNEEYYQNLLGPAAAAATSTPRMEFVCLDITQTPLPFDNGSFDLIICKGVFDAILCSLGSVFNIRRLIKECVRLLNDDGGVLMVCTYGNPDNRVVFLEDEQGELDTYWHGVSIHTIPSMVRARNKNGSDGSNKNDYVYLCRKKRGAWKENMSITVEQKEDVLTDEKKDETLGQESENKPNVVSKTKDSSEATTSQRQGATA